jgi:molybdopterin converting factor small subunit
MMVRLRVFGVLSQYLGGIHQTVELPEGATLGDLLAEIGCRWGEQLPERLWDAEGAGRFRGPVILRAGGSDLHDVGAPLPEGQEVAILMPIAGG